MINALGEMISHVPAAGGQMTLAKRYFDPALAFAMGYNYVRQLVLARADVLSTTIARLVCR